MVVNMNQPTSYIAIPLAALAGLLLHSSHPAHSSPGTPPDAGSTGEKLPPTGSDTSHAPYGSHLQPILETVHATPEQRKKITEIVLQFRPTIEPVMIKYREKRNQFLHSIVTGSPAEDIMSKQAEVNELFDKICNDYCLMNLKVRRQLTAHQCDLLQQYRRKQGWIK